MHKFPLISHCTSNCVGRIWAGSKLQVVCKEIQCSEVPFSTFPVVTRVPRFKRLNRLLCLLHNLQNCKQRATRKAQILPLSTLTCPLSQRSLSSGSLLCCSAVHFGSFFQVAEMRIYYAHPYNYLHLHTCMCSAGCPHGAHLPGWHRAHRDVGRPLSLKRSCQAVTDFGGQPGALPSAGTKASQCHSRLCGTPRGHNHWHACQSKEDFKGERKEESWLVLQTVIQTHFVEVIMADNAAEAEHRPAIT